jgi:hypothetical protein
MCPSGCKDAARKISKRHCASPKALARPTMEPFGWNYKPAEKHRWLIFCERKILFRLKKQAE